MNSSAPSANVSGHDNIVVQASGSGVNVAIGAKPYLRLTQYERRTRLAERDNSEAALLSAYRADVVPLIGRDGAMADLRRWLDDPAALSVRVLVGPGGRGKTRLALELAREIAKDGWLAGFVKSTADEDELDRFRSQNGVHEWRWDKPILIIIDYAASRAAQLRNWLRELVDASFEDRPKLRLLLLERQANRAIGWLATIFSLGDNDDSRAAIALLDPQEPVDLPALDELEFRRQVFGALLKRANGALAAPAPDADPEFDRLLADRKWAGDPLYLMMAGLAAAKAGVHGALTLSRADLALSTARNELDRIGRIGAARGVDEKHQFPGAFVRHMAAIATLTQGLTVAEARELAAREIEALRSMAALDAALAALTDSLPAANPSSGVAPILPDIVGEGAILAWFGPNGGLATIGVDPQTRIAAAARTALAKASATLVRTAQDFAAAGYAEPVQWLEALAVAPDTDLGALVKIADALPHRTLALMELAAALETRIAKSLSAVAAGEAATGRGGPAQVLYAHTLDNLANRLSELGRREEALEVIQEAVRIHRRLAGERPDTSNPALAVSLNNLGLILSALGWAERALTATEESVEVRRRLAAEQPERYLPDLAGVLSNLGKLLDEQGRREDALKAAEESVEIYRHLAAERPDAFLPVLAIPLLNLGKFLAELGHLEHALAATLEATDLCRRLAAERPDAFLPDLLGSLSNLRTRLCALGRREDALKATQEAIDLSRRLASMQSEVFSANLAMSLRRRPKTGESGWAFYWRGLFAGFQSPGLKVYSP